MAEQLRLARKVQGRNLPLLPSSPLVAAGGRGGDEPLHTMPVDNKSGCDTSDEAGGAKAGLPTLG